MVRGLLCVLDADGIEGVPEPDKEIMTTRKNEEMLDKMRYYMPTDDMRRMISGAGRKRVLHEHTYEA